MKKKLLVFTIFAVAVLLTATEAGAQSFNSYRAHVPFDFVVGQKSYEAGDYLVKFGEQSTLSKIFKLSSSEGHTLQVAAVIKNGKTSGSKNTVLIFNRYGDDYVLSQILFPNFGFRAPKVDTAVWVTITKNHRERPKSVAVKLHD